MPQQPEKPQQPQLPNDTRTQAIGSEELPYVNEVEAALARKPRLGARFLSLAVGLFFLILGIWANFAEIDEVTHANGQVISSQRTQIIQNLEGGILGAVLVGEGHAACAARQQTCREPIPRRPEQDLGERAFDHPP